MSSWDQLIASQLASPEQARDGVVHSFALVTMKGACLSSRGRLAELPQEFYAALVRDAFAVATDGDGEGFPEDEDAGAALIDCIAKSTVKNNRLAASGFSLLDRHFVVFSYTLSSVYAASDGRRFGCSLHRLPFGVLIATWKAPVLAQVAIPIIEAFCDSLKYTDSGPPFVEQGEEAVCATLAV